MRWFKRSRKPVVYCVLDTFGWVQEKRAKLLSEHLPEFRFVVLDAGRFATLWNKGELRGEAVYFASWRVPFSLIGSERCAFAEPDFEGFMTSVTSHYNIGGGLNQSTALPSGMDPKEAFDSAVELLRRFKVATVNSRTLYDLLAPHVGGLIYAPNGVDAEFFHPPDAKDFDPDDVKIGWVGIVRASKNYQVAESALTQLAQDGFTVRVIAPAKGASKREHLSAGEMRDFYHELDYYLCTSWHEGTPNPALEAGACGVPVVTTRVGNMSELITHGENGFFIEPTVDSVVGRFQEVRGFGRDDYLQLSANMRRNILTDWTWQKNIANYELAFEKMFDGLG